MNILFEDNFDTGDFSRWDIVSPSGLVQYKVQTQIVHSGTRAAKLSIQPLWFLARPGVRLGWQNKRLAVPSDPANLPDRAYYSAWYYLPTYVQTSGLNLMQWKQPIVLSTNEQTREPTLNVQLRGSGGVMMLCLRNRVDANGGYFAQGTQAAEHSTPVPVAEWFEINCVYEWSKEPSGCVATWLNDQLLWDVDGIRTAFSRPFLAYPRQWTVNNYAGDVKPSPYSLYIDDAKVWTE